MVLWFSFLLRWRGGKDESGLAGGGEGEGGVGAAGSDRDWDVSRPQWHCQVRWCDLAVLIERGSSSPDEGGRTEPWFIKFQPILAFSDIEEHPRRSARLGRDQGKGQGCRGSRILSGSSVPWVMLYEGEGEGKDKALPFFSVSALDWDAQVDVKLTQIESCLYREAVEIFTGVVF